VVDDHHQCGDKSQPVEVGEVHSICAEPGHIISSRV
jgi:hypothetical protein